MSDDRLYLIHISECIDRIETYTRGMTREAFLESSLVQDAVIRNLQTLSESTQRLSEGTKASQPEIKRYQIAGFRNVLVHDYLGVDVERVWNIVSNRVERTSHARSETGPSRSEILERASDPTSGGDQTEGPPINNSAVPAT